MKNALIYYAASAFIILFSQVVQAVPIEQTNSTVNATTSVKLENTTVTSLAPVTTPVKSQVEAQDLEAAATEEKQSAFSLPDNAAAGSNFDPSFYTGLLTPDAFQQYVNQFGAAAAYSPYAPAYPTPVGYGPPPPPPVYPSPYVVQTGYEGYLVPTTTASTTTTTTAASDTTTTTTASSLLSNPITTFTNLINTFMNSTLFRMLAAVVSAISMYFFGTAIMNAVCNFTPLCDISNRTVIFLKRRGSEKMGRMIAEELTPERLRRATEFVWNATRKYRELQRLLEKEENEYKID